jgi:pyruvate, water dikinase
MTEGASIAVPLDAKEAADSKRFGPKAANLAALAQAGLPTPGGTCIDAQAYRIQLAHLGLEASARRAASAELMLARRCALQVRLGLFEKPLAPPLIEPLLGAWRALSGAPGAVRSSALVEDREASSFAGQFESYLGVETEADFLTAVRASWAALWSVRALRYMASRGVDPAETAMAILVQRLVAARVSGGGLSRTASGEMLLSAAPGLGSAIAQGEVVPDRYLLGREEQGFALRRAERDGAEHPIDVALLRVERGRTAEHRAGCEHEPSAARSAAAARACLDESQGRELGRLLLRAEEVLGVPVEIEWALDGTGFKLLQARPLRLGAAQVSDEPLPRHRGVTGEPAGIGQASGRACVVSCECELGRVAPGDVLVTKVASPALTHVLGRVAAVVTELGGSTSHLASLARERGIPLVLGVADATARIPDGVQVAVDGASGIVRWTRRKRARSPESESTRP